MQFRDSFTDFSSGIIKGKVRYCSLVGIFVSLSTYITVLVTVLFFWVTSVGRFQVSNINPIGDPCGGGHVKISN